MTQTVQLLMEKMAQGGDAISHLEDGRVCFVSGALAGERAEVFVTQQKKDYARGRALKILEPSPFRVKPKCPLYGKCGGCSLGHASFDFQLQTARAAVEELFRRFAKTDLPADWKIHSGAPYGYRNRARLVRAGNGFGFRAEQSHRPIAVSSCEILTKGLNEALKQNAFPKVPELSVFENGEGRLSYFYRGMDRSEFERNALNTVQIGGRTLSMDAACFFQSNLSLLPELVKAVRESAGEGERLIDLYSGVGFFAALLQDKFQRIDTVERDPGALFHAKRNVSGAHSVSAPAEEWLQNADASGADVLIVDPPRTGLLPSVIDAISKASPKKLLYVSCDPATLARDFRLFALLGYAIFRAEGFAFYPQTPHFEMFLELRRP